MWHSQHNLFWLFPLIIPVIIIETVLKSMALWRAARNNQLYWFVALIIFNTVGILPLLYILFFQEKRKEKK